MIIATAGHVDHGKTSLIRQLTGVETDTLAEEKERGLSINLGYAYLPHPTGGPLGFIDVPGHQRFINTMISGISGIDMGLLVVAADDGPMPQTSEHLDVLDILGVDRLAVAISKIDRVTGSQLLQVENQIGALLRSGRWVETALFPVSSTTGAGLATLKAHLLQQAELKQEAPDPGGFRLSVDRCFTAKGAGLIVTGTASAGSVHTGDTLTLLPSRLNVRVRGLRAHDEVVDTAGKGQRVALNLAGRIDTSDIARGDWLVDPDHALASSRLDVAFELLGSAPFSLKHLAPIKLYIGARRVAGRLALINSASRRLAPGYAGLAQLILEQSVSAIVGERFLLRDQAENVTLGGGQVLDPLGPKYGKSRARRLTWLRAMQAPRAEDALAQLLAHNVLVDLDRFWAIRNRKFTASSARLPGGTKQFNCEGANWAVRESIWQEAGEALLQEVDHWHDTHPQQPGIKITDLKAALARHIESPLSTAVLVSRLKAGDLVLREGHIHRRGFQRAESAQARDYWNTLRQHLETCGLRIPARSELLQATGIPEQAFSQLIKAATRDGDLVRVNDNRYALPEQLLYFSERLVEADNRGEELSVIKLKAHFRTGRNLTVEVLEYFDSIRFTRRQGNTRIVLDSAMALEQFAE